MKKLFFYTSLIMMLSLVLISCKRDDDEKKKGNQNTTGQVMFWTSSDLGCGNITVTINGTSKSITGFYSGGAPDCGAASAATFDLESGTYSFTVSCGSNSGNGTVTVTAGSCYKMEITADITGGGTCNYTQWTGTENCNSGYYPVYTGICGPVGYPFYNTATNLCYKTCQDARNANTSGQIYRYNDTGGGGGGTCNYTQWTGTESCNSGYYPVYTGICAPVDYPFYNTATNLCYKTCQDARNANTGGQIYRYNESGGGGGSTTGQVMFWIQSDLGCGNITVTVSGSSKSITGYYSGGAPSCGSSSTATFTLNPGTYSFNASCSGKTWNGNVTVTAGNCFKMQLTN
jgi:hypothetical protein